MWHETPVFLKTHMEDVLFLGDKWKKVKYLTKKWKSNDFVFFSTEIFLSPMNKN